MNKEAKRIIAITGFMDRFFRSRKENEDSLFSGNSEEKILMLTMIDYLRVLVSEQ